MKKGIPSAQEFRAAYRYDPATGDIFRIATGQLSNSKPTTKYRLLCLNYRVFLAHRVIWLMQTGEWPSGTIDHINGIKTDNRWVNLRDITHAQNGQNVRNARRNSSSGLLGAFPKRGKWFSSIKTNSKPIYLGTFNTAEEAHAAYLAAKMELHISQ